MSELNGHLWVDPEGVLSVSRAYDGHVAMYDRYLRRLDHLRRQYAEAWGDDEIGNQFKGQFDNVMDIVEGIILGVRGSVEYAAVGLRISGEGYQQAEDDATEAGRIIDADFAALPTQVAARQPVEAPTHYASRQPALPVMEMGTLAPMHAVRRPHEPVLQAGLRLQGRPIEPEEGELTPMLAAERQPVEPALQAGVLLPGRLIEPDTHSRGAVWRDDDAVLRPLMAVRGKILDSEDDADRPLSRLTPRLPAEPGVPATFTPATPATSAVPLTPATSTHLSHPTEGVLINGVPVPEGFQLRTLNTFEDGTSRLDVNYYESVLPLGDGHVVTGPDGQPVDPDGGHLFLIKPRENAVDPTSPDYHPMLFSFAADGTPVPL
ncbi:hypothetical protein AWW66_20810 [Micromonospora rosaria]|uniref:WXG100 family type VII secretion target n=1 Tax=Micromonospora rosaria TaxID=47874 RepID=A0A136PNK4_9ACTN|nr:hypothetical protein [Micromonospora rosaria]KXK60060.1 hypothetical protein AWW66_20810 [Micromonospora rosaria]